MMQSLTDIRATFIDYFKKNGHEHVSSSPLVPHNDPTLLFTNAGMVQFKDVFTGLEKRPYQRATTAQKCLRAGGKHNDLENVGYTARHHTFFEMLGNFSFGDYFKEEAISYAWELVTKEFQLPQDRLIVTVYDQDTDAALLWKKIAGISDDRIIRISTHDNFWSMGDTGPCGPCTEIFYDHGDHIPGGPPGSPDEDGDRFIEIWNLVFMQFEQLADGRRINLPKPSVDTGMGIERVAAVLQGVHTNYETDLFQNLIQASIELTKATADFHRQSHQVIADHLRACSFLLADGVMPSNEGRGYVLRRIMRRAMRHAHLLGAKEPLMHRLAPRLIDLMGGVYPELMRAQSMICENLRLEEDKFRHTLERGLRLLTEETTKLSPSQSLSGDVAFKLYDTFGFPIDLTQDVLRTQNRQIDLAGFHTAMADQKAAARAAWVGTGDAKNEHVWYDLRDQCGASEFLGYDTIDAEGIVLAIVDDKNIPLQKAKPGDHIQILINQTAFYAESGGQVGDIGTIIDTHGLQIQITDTTKKVGALHIHHGRITAGELTLNQPVKLHVDEKHRRQVRANHSATHLLHAALRQVLGYHVTQKGSLVDADRLRFDFTHTKPLTVAEITAIETIVNEQIQQNYPVETHLMTPDEAIAKGAMALFGERYGDEVRVLSMGKTTEKPLIPAENTSFSIELCGGTHAERTGEIGLCKIITETGISSGVRRLEAITGLKALSYTQNMQSTLSGIAALVRAPIAEIYSKIDHLLTDRRTFERQVADLRKQLALITPSASSADKSGNSDLAPCQIGNFSFIHQHLVDFDAKDLKSVVDTLKKQLEKQSGTGVVAVTCTTDDKISIVIGVTETLTPRISAVDLVKIAAPILGGKGGGGRPDLAQAGGTQAEHIADAITAITDALKEKTA